MINISSETTDSFNIKAISNDIKIINESSVIILSQILYNYSVDLNIRPVITAKFIQSDPFIINQVS